MAEQKRCLLYNPFDKFRGLPKVQISQGSGEVTEISNRLKTMLSSLSVPAELLVITRESDDPFPPGFVNLIEPVDVNDTVNSTVDISGADIKKN